MITDTFDVTINAVRSESSYVHNMATRSYIHNMATRSYVHNMATHSYSMVRIDKKINDENPFQNKL